MECWWPSGTLSNAAASRQSDANVKPHELVQTSRRRQRRRRVGRGEGSGRGKTAGRGTLGQGARSGSGPTPGFEGGQTPLLRRFPARRGFTNDRFRTVYQPVNLGRLAQFEAGSVVGAAELRARGIVDNGLFKILAGGELPHALTIRAPKFSAAAKVKIEEAGGTAEEIPA